MVQLYIMRHGIAEDYASDGRDASRLLTDEGMEKTRRMAKLLKEMRLAPPTIMVQSTLIRAQQTAAIAREIFAPESDLRTSRALEPGADIAVTMALVAELARQSQSIMLVGHEPHLSSFGGALVSGMMRPVIEMKKSAVALFELTNLDVPRMRGILTMLLPPRVAK